MVVLAKRLKWGLVFIRDHCLVHYLLSKCSKLLSKEFKEGLPMELLYVDDLVLMADTEELLVTKIQKWKEYVGEGTQSKLR